MQTVENTIDLTALSTKLVTDSPNKRVLLFSNEQAEKSYKTIFIKEQKRLKIIDINKDKLIFNDII